MTNYWARFEDKNGNIFRFDTRVYLKPINEPSCSKDVCIGAVIGKNPGSAQPSDCNSATLQPIILDNDKLLPTVKNIMTKAYNEAGIALEENANGYIQILNLFYLCEKSIRMAKERIKNYQPNYPICCSEGNNFNFILYAWGGPKDGLGCFKKRFFNNMRVKNNIWFDRNAREIKYTIPDENGFAKHIQGLSHEFIVPGIVEILRKPVIL